MKNILSLLLLALPFLTLNGTTATCKPLLNQHLTSSTDPVTIEVLANRLKRCARNKITLLVKNDGSQALFSAEARLKLPPYVILLSATRPFLFDPVDSVYRFSGLSIQAGKSESIQIVDSVLCIDGLMGVNQCIKARLLYSNNELPSTESTHLESGDAAYCLPITDSYDPNDKSVNPRGITSLGRIPIGNSLTYTIRFQNLGTAEATNVVVVDTLDVNLDIGTFNQGPSSHPYLIQVGGAKNSRLVKWTLNGINLPPASLDEVGSNGYVSFTVYPKETAIVGARIYNTADIYFDFNAPVRTNTTLNTLHLFGPIPNYLDSVEVSTVKPVSKKSDFQVFPNPSTGSIRIKSGQKSTGVLFSMRGEKVMDLQLVEGNNFLNLASLPKGIYVFRLMDSGGNSAIQKVELE